MADEIRVSSTVEDEVHRMAGEAQDEVEGILVVEAIEPAAHRLDPLALVREHPLRALGLVFGAGIALGLLTGGDGDRVAEDDEDQGEDYEDEEEYEDEDEEGEDGTSATDRIRSFLSAHLSGLAVEAIQQIARRVTHR